jgi:pimeloyl-ACP methyl ester carboxylesterase
MAMIKEEAEHKYIEQGEGPVLIVLHGLFGALSNFKDVLDEFSKDYKVVIPIMPIYELPLLKTNVKELAAYIHSFIEFKSFNSVALLGNSLGGHVSLVYTVAHPEKVNAIVLTGSSGLYENAFGGSFPRREDRGYIRKKVETTFYDPANATDELIEEVFGIINDRNKLIRVLAIAKSAIRHNMKDVLPSITIPACLIWGKNDGVTPPEVAEDFHSLLPNSELHWIDKCGHAPMMEHPEEFNGLLAPWLKTHVLNN